MSFARVPQSGRADGIVGVPAAQHRYAWTAQDAVTWLAHRLPLAHSWYLIPRKTANAMQTQPGGAHVWASSGGQSRTDIICASRTFVEAETPQTILEIGSRHSNILYVRRIRISRSLAVACHDRALTAVPCTLDSGCWKPEQRGKMNPSRCCLDHRRSCCSLERRASSAAFLGSTSLFGSIPIHDVPGSHAHGRSLEQEPTVDSVQSPQARLELTGLPGTHERLPVVTKPAEVVRMHSRRALEARRLLSSYTRVLQPFPIEDVDIAVGRVV